MKRSYSDMSTSLLPIFASSDDRKFKSALEGTYKLRVMKSVDISKPIDKPVDEIEEPEDEDIARENKLNQNSARMLQLILRDTNGTEINAVEVERVELLSNLKPCWKVIISGPVEVRCGNIMLEKKHVLSVEPPTEEEIQQARGEAQSGQCSIPTAVKNKPTLTNQMNPTQPSPQAQPPPPPPPPAPQPVVHIVEDWDEEDEDDCIILD